MTRFIIALAIAAAVTPALAAPAFAAPAPQQIRFERDGRDYVATVRTTRSGQQHLSGKELKSGDRFELTIASGMVTGIYGRTEVRYAVPTGARPLQTALDTSAQ